MRIAFFAIGTRGDIEPLVALAKGFADAGHEVRFITDESGKPLVAPFGIDGHFLPGNFRDRWIEQSAGRPRYIRYPYKMAQVMTRAFAAYASSWAAGAAEAAQGSRLLISCAGSYGLGYAIAEKIRAIPCEANVTPFKSSRYLPSALLPWPGAPVPGGVKRLLNEAALRAAWLGARDVVNAARRALGLEEIPWPFGRARPGLLDGIPQLYGFSPILFPRPPDWPKNITVTGYWQRRGVGSWQPPTALSAFLDSGPPPVYVGFGSMFEPRPAELRDIVVRAIRGLGVRAVVSTGWGAMGAASATDDIFVVDDVPHEWLFARVAAVVHHGGSGTVGATLRAGKPAVIVPYVVDQPFWGWALERLGVAARTIPRWRLSRGALTAALRQAMGDRMRQRAKDVGEVVQAEDGARRAVEVVEAWLSPLRASAPARPQPLPSSVQKPI